MEVQKNHAAKFAFFYLLSLVALVFVAIAAGTILFQIINKQVADIIDYYSSYYSQEAMRFGISALIIASPIFYISSRQIYRSLYKGTLSAESGVRKWLTYLIILVAIIVMIGWLIAILNEFLGGELSTRFVLKALTALVISGIIFSFYLYDIKREQVANRPDKVIRIYFFASLAIILGVLTAAFLVIDSPAESRDKKIDQNIINHYYSIDSAINSYVSTYDKMPESLEALKNEYNYLTEEQLKNPLNNEYYQYRVLAEREYELCTNFKASNKDNEGMFRDNRWLHDAGYQCISQKVIEYGKDGLPVPRPL